MNQIIINIMVVFMVLAALDRCIGCRFGLGGKLDEALATMGPMCIPMVGMILLAPSIGDLLEPLVSPIFTAMGADPAIFAGAILACDMGGYPLALRMAQDPQAGLLSGCILACSLGGVISFIIPVGITMVRKEYHSSFAVGVLTGVITVPLGMFAGGLAAGYPVKMLLHNTFPVVLISLAITLGLWRAQELLIRIFGVFGRILTAVSVFGFAVGVIQELTPLVIMPGLPPVLDAVGVVGSVAIVLCGAYPMLAVINRVFSHAIQKAGSFLGIDQTATTGIVGGFANIMPILGSCNDMSPAGVAVSMAFAVSASCVFGDHLGFVASVDKSMIVPMIASKLVGGFSALFLAAWLSRKLKLSNVVMKDDTKA